MLGEEEWYWEWGVQCLEAGNPRCNGGDRKPVTWGVWPRTMVAELGIKVAELRNSASALETSNTPLPFEEGP